MPRFTDFDLDIQNLTVVDKATGDSPTYECNTKVECLDTYACQGSRRGVCYLTVFDNCD